LWNSLQKFDATRLILCHVEASKALQEQWDHEIQWFFPSEVEEEIVNMTITEKLQLYHEGGSQIGIACTLIRGIIMPSKRLIDHLRFKNNLMAPTSENIDKLETLIAPIRDAYIELFHKTVDWNTTFPSKSVDDILDVMDSFERYGCSISSRVHMLLTFFCLRITPLPVKCGDLLFLSTTPECYRSYVSVETVVLSMLFNKDLKVPDSKSKTQLKNREKAKAANPFTLKAIVAKEKKAAEKIEPRWAPVIETFSQVDSASLAATTGYYGSKKVYAVCMVNL